MRTSNFLISTIKDTPSDAVTVSHQLMIKSGMIRQLTNGIYSYLPLGLKVLRNIESIVRQEMDKIGAQEVLMPMVQPDFLWKESSRWEQYGLELLRFQDRHKREYCLGPTHEEVITFIAKNEIQSYKQLPISFYQIQTKFRDEIRPRFGVMRSREFIMKDAYSFHLNQDSLKETYSLMYKAYSNIFSRFGLKYCAVKADNGSIGGNGSHEFHVLAQSGEDLIVFSDQSDYAANLEKASSKPSKEKPSASTQDLKLINTFNIKIINEVASFLNVKESLIVKTIVVKGLNDDFIALVLKGDDKLNEIKASNLEEVLSPLTFATNDEIEESLNVSVGSIGVINQKLKLLVDVEASLLSDFVSGGNQKDTHYIGCNWQRDVKDFKIVDIREVKEGDLSPDGRGKLKFARGIEVGHIFQLGDKYSKALNVEVRDQNGQCQTILMGCYGIGISRLIASVIEQQNDENGIIWPLNIAPFQIAIIPISYEKIKSDVDSLYQKLIDKGLTVLLDDRDKKTSIGKKFADIDLIGIPYRLVLSQKLFDQNQIEIKKRNQKDSFILDLNQILNYLEKEIHKI